MTIKEEEDPDIEIIKARKLKEMREKAAALERAKNVSSQPTTKKRTAREVVSSYLYDRGEEVLNLAYAQYPAQTEAIISRIAELMLAGEITSRISGGELLALFRSVGLNIRVNTSIKIEDKGKLIPFSDKLKQQNMNDD
ncbi:MAG TPA: DNA-binding protein [Nitrososphaera sp.]|jgi:DNA-binding TFAR19-related protein (PDSD5 family)